jgi:protein TonB
MIAKKNPETDLEKYRGLFFKIGLISAMMIVFLALEWQVNKSNANQSYILADADIEYEYLPPVTKTETEKPKPKPNFSAFNFSESEAPDESEAIDMESFENKAIEISLPKEENENDESIILFPPIQPEFPGGEAGLRKFIAQHLIYPPDAIEQQIEGKVFVRFIINSKGKVIQPKIIRSVDSLLDKEALRIINMLPAWKPGMNNGKALNVSYTVPVTFRLQ